MNRFEPGRLCLAGGGAQGKEQAERVRPVRMQVSAIVRQARGMVLFPIRFGVVSYTIRILMYPDVSRVYPVEYMYPGCILMYLKCILNALLHSKRIHVS